MYMKESFSYQQMKCNSFFMKFNAFTNQHLAGFTHHHHRRRRHRWQLLYSSQFLESEN